MSRSFANLIIFDLDGTLIDTAPDLAHCVDLVMLELDLPRQSLQKVRRYIGNGILRLVQDVLREELDNEPDKDLVNQAFNSFLKHYQKNFAQQSCLYPNVKNTLEKLKSNNVKLACITNKLEVFTLSLLGHFKILKYFDLVLSGDSLEKKKPDAFPLEHACKQLGVIAENSIMVGDSKNDVLAAKNASMKSIFVNYGYTDIDEIEKFKPDIILDSFSYLLDHI